MSASCRGGRPLQDRGREEERRGDQVQMDEKRESAMKRKREKMR